MGNFVDKLSVPAEVKKDVKSKLLMNDDVKAYRIFYKAEGKSVSQPGYFHLRDKLGFKNVGADRLAVINGKLERFYVDEHPSKLPTGSLIEMRKYDYYGYYRKDADGWKYLGYHKSGLSDENDMYNFAKKNGAIGGKLAGAGGGGAYILFCNDPVRLTSAMKKRFVDCFELQFDFHYDNIKELNRI